MQTNFRKSIPKITGLYLLICLFSFISSIVQANPQDSILFPGHDLLHIQHFEVSASQDQDHYMLSIKALTSAGINDFSISGPHRFIIAKDTHNLYFSAGRAVVKLDDIDRTILIKYVGSSRVGTPMTQEPVQKLFRFSVDAGNVSQTHIPLWTSILPPLLAIFLALVLKEVIISLFAGVWLGAFIMYGFDPRYIFQSIFRVGDTYLLGSLANTDHAAIILFSLLIGGMVAIISRNGGMAGIVQKLSRFANSSRNAQLITWTLGIGIFFDDYANTLIVGNTMRPVTDRFRVSREKLAYIVDSTAAPVAAIAFITTWIGAELGYIESAINQLGIDATAYSVFLGSLQYSFYPVLTLIFIVLIIFLKRDFGPMRKAELRAREKGEVYATKITEKKEGPVDDSFKNLDALEGIRYRWYNAFVPILTVIVVTIIGLLMTGHDAALWASDASFFSKLTGTIGQADSFTALIWGSSFGVFMAILLTALTKTMSVRYTIESMMDGFKTMLPAIIILVLAWSIALLTEELHTAEFLTQVFGGNVAPQYLPAITFVLAALISFSTGSSWSTMAIMYPLMLPTVWILGQEAGMAPDELLHVLYNVAAVVLGGSVLGDHCSPISDTTVLSSLATGCNHIDHVRTQLPYALTVGMISLLVGGFLFTLGWPWYIDYVIGMVLVVAAALLLTKKVPQAFLDKAAEQEVKTDSQSPG